MTTKKQKKRGDCAGDISTVRVFNRTVCTTTSSLYIAQYFRVVARMFANSVSKRKTPKRPASNRSSKENEAPRHVELCQRFPRASI
jgi:hypothetical protein